MESAKNKKFVMIGTWNEARTAAGAALAFGGMPVQVRGGMPAAGRLVLVRKILVMASNVPGWPG